MIQASTIQFLKGLKKNNDRAWMEKNKAAYHQAKENFLELVEIIIRELATIDPEISGMEAKKCVFRINRDIRFSANKSPYKTNLAAYVNKGGKKIHSAGYYIHLEPGHSFLAGGVYVPEAEQLAAIRQEIDYNLPEWEKLIKAGTFKKLFPHGPDTEHQLSRPPKGYTADNPALAYLKLKSFTFTYPVDDALFMKKDAYKEIIRVFKALNPVISFLNRAEE